MLTTRTPDELSQASMMCWPCSAVAGLDRDVAQDAVAGHLDQVHGADVPAGLADDRRDAAQHAGLVPDPEPNRMKHARRRWGLRQHQSLVMAGI